MELSNVVFVLHGSLLQLDWLLQLEWFEQSGSEEFGADSMGVNCINVS